MNVQELIDVLNKIEDKRTIVATKQYDSDIDLIVDKESLYNQIERVNKRNSIYLCI